MAGLGLLHGDVQVVDALDPRMADLLERLAARMPQTDIVSAVGAVEKVDGVPASRGTSFSFTEAPTDFTPANTSAVGGSLSRQLGGVDGRLYQLRSGGSAALAVDPTTASRITEAATGNAP